MKKHNIIDNPSVSRIIFFPRKIAIPEKLESNVEILRFDIGNKIIIGGFIFKINKNFPTILLFHGNGEIAIDYQSIAPLYFECGVNLAVVDFRGYGFSSGTPYFTSLITDSMPIFEKFVEWIKINDFKLSIFVQGRSLGSVCAAEIGSKNPKELRGIIFESAFGSIFNMMTRLFRIESPNLNPEVLEPFSNDFKAKFIRKPCLILHGTSDWIIPYYESKLLYNSIPSDIEKKLVLIEGAGHNDILYYKEEYFSELKKFITRHE